MPLRLPRWGSNAPAASSGDPYPTLTFNSPPQNADGSDSVCARCLTLLMHVADIFGDGTGNDGQEIPHTRSIRDPSPACVICKRMIVLFGVARDYTGFEETLTTSPIKAWSLAWQVDAAKPVARVGPEHFWPRHDHIVVYVTARHKHGYSWGIGGFKLYADIGAQSQQRIRSAPIITSLDRPTHPSNSSGIDELDFSSTVGSGPISLIKAWSRECADTHAKCNHIFARDSLEKPAEPWFPDRLVKVTMTSHDGAASADQINARIVEKSDLAEFPHQMLDQLQYLSLSHCWGEHPSFKYCLTRKKLSKWRRCLPVDSLAQTFQDAIQVCALLRFEYIWIDSLCIVQDDIDDWHAQAEQMDSVYKHAWLNIAALVSLSDQEGFINRNRDPRIKYGFRLSLAQLFGSNVDQRDSNRSKRILLHGDNVLVWNKAKDFCSSWAGNAPLFDRAWVFQERNMSRRTVGFNRDGILWVCDGFKCSELPEGGSLFEESHLRSTLQGLRGAAVEELALQSLTASEQTDAELGKQTLHLARSFNTGWGSSVDTYTRCKLTYQTDRLMAFSAIAREFASSGMMMQARYLAGLWDIDLSLQIGWTASGGEAAPSRKGVGERGYTAPSWSWASIEAPVSLAYLSANRIALADVIDADVVLEKDSNKFGPVTAGWLRVRGHLNEAKDLSWFPIRLTDKATGKELYFDPDTVEGYDVRFWRENLDKLIWVPLRLDFEREVIRSNYLILAAVNDYRGGSTFVRPGERVFRRLGTGGIVSPLTDFQNNTFMPSLGTCRGIDAAHDTGLDIQTKFRRKEEGFVEFVII